MKSRMGKKKWADLSPEERRERNRHLKSLEKQALLSRKLNDAISGRVFYADFGTPQGNQSL